MTPSHILPLFALCIFVLSQAAVLVRWAELPADSIGFWRMALTVPILFGWSLRAGQLKREYFANKGTWPRVLGCAAFLFLHWRLWFLAVEKTTIANATICFAATPLLTALGARLFFKELIGPRLLLALSMGIAGIVWMEWGELKLREGDVLGLLSTACFAGYILAGKSIRARVPNLIFTLWTYSLVGLAFSVSMSWTETPWTGYPLKSWACLVALTLGPTLLGHAVFTYCLNYLNVNFMTCATLFEPIFAGLTAAWLFAEPLRGQTVGAFVLVSVGVLILYAANLNFRMKSLTGKGA